MKKIVLILVVILLATITFAQQGINYKAIITTNGIAIANIGEGTQISGVFNDVDWSEEQFLKVEINTGSGYVDFGTMAFKAVPYAKYAGNGGGGAKKLNDLTDAKIDVMSVFIGRESGNVGNGNNANVAVGNITLKYNTSGGSNTAIGFAALHNNTTGDSNIANGDSSLSQNTTGYKNTANGTMSLNSNTTE